MMIKLGDLQSELPHKTNLMLTNSIDSLKANQEEIKNLKAKIDKLQEENRDMKHTINELNNDLDHEQK